MKKYIEVIIKTIIVIVFISLSFLFLTLTNTNNIKQNIENNETFYIGEIVLFKLTNKKGIIIDKGNYGGTWIVRYESNQKIETDGCNDLLSGGLHSHTLQGSFYTEDVFKEFELKKIKENINKE